MKGLFPVGKACGAVSRRTAIGCKGVAGETFCEVFGAILSRGRAAINMPIQTLTQFLKEGVYLNIYELEAR